MSYAAIVERPLDPSTMLARVSSPAIGAALVFVGTVRDVNDGRAVEGLDYSAYGPMAERELSDIVSSAEEQWPGARVACEHRVGALELGDASVVIAASHPHRGEAFDVCRYVIEQLKARLPIWKRERYADGELAWVENATGAGRSAG